MFYKLLKTQDFTDLWRPRENFILISIRKPDEGIVGKFTDIRSWTNCKGLLSLIDNIDNFTFSEENAEKIIKFFLENKDNIETVYLHTSLKRSLIVGIAAAFGKILDESCWIFENGRHTPNLNVKYQLLDIYNNIKNGVNKPEETWY